MRTFAVSYYMTWLLWLNVKIITIGFLDFFKSHFVRHAASCHTSKKTKIIQKIVKDALLLHTASVSPVPTLTSLTKHD